MGGGGRAAAAPAHPVAPPGPPAPMVPSRGGVPQCPEGCGWQGGSGHTSEEEQRCLSHAGAALASTCLVTGKSQPRSALPSVKWILAAPPLKQSRRSGAMAGALSHGSLASSTPCESAPSRAGAGCPRMARVPPAGQSQGAQPRSDGPVLRRGQCLGRDVTGDGCDVSSCLPRLCSPRPRQG